MKTVKRPIVVGLALVISGFTISYIQGQLGLFMTSSGPSYPLGFPLLALVLACTFYGSGLIDGLRNKPANRSGQTISITT